MTKLMSYEALEKAISTKSIDTVVVAFVDMQGRFMGKQFHAAAFLDMAHDETHCCNYLLATDLAMATPDGYASTSWSAGYGDYIMKPDLSTIRPMPWREGSAIVLCDVIDHHTHKGVSHSPRHILKTQVEKAKSMGFDPVMATELEFFLFQGTHDQIADKGFRKLKPISHYNEDYHIFQTAKEEYVMRPIRNHLYEMGIPVEGSKGEAEAGQEELNIKYAGALDTADHHSLAKLAIKEIAHQHGLAATFLPKWHHERVGSSSHIHQSLWSRGENAFYDPDMPWAKSKLMDSYIAGLLKYARDYTYFLAPYINSYKRFAKGSFAPTKITWSIDNRTAAFRLVGEGTKGVRVECRIPGADVNPYLGEAALLAAGLKGIEEELTLDAPSEGDNYDASASEENIPTNLYDARTALSNSKMLREAMGDDVIDHYVRAASWEIEEFERVVTDYEIARGFEKV